MLTGGDLEKLKDEALWHLAPRTDLFVEIDPQQKERIVHALQRTGHSWGIWAMASTMRQLCMRPMSVFRLQRPSMSRARALTSFC